MSVHKCTLQNIPRPGLHLRQSVYRPGRERSCPYQLSGLTLVFTSALLIGAQCQALPALCAGEDNVPRKSEEKPAVEPTRAHRSTLTMPLPVPVVGKDPLPRAEENSFSEPLKPTLLQGSVRHDALHGAAREETNDLREAEAQRDGEEQLQGFANNADLMADRADPDCEDQELMVEWDRWRNTFLWAIQSGMQAYLNDPYEQSLRWDEARQSMVSSFPMGTVAFFRCRVTPDRRIIDLEITHPSGYEQYDRALVRAIKELEGSAILKYPARSRRKIVAQAAGIKTSETSVRQYFKFGDVERYRQSSREEP